MKPIFTLLVLLISLYSNAQTICGTANEGGVVTLTAPPGSTFTSIEFASYGTPNGVCGSFTIGACNAGSSVGNCETVFIGVNSASISATNGVFGDPCGGTPKRLYIQARYSSTLPLTLISFTARKFGLDKIRLDWESDHEINTSHFVIERSSNGILFEPAGTVAVTGTGNGDYEFTDLVSNSVPTYFYRLKMVDRDGRFKYSNIVRINNAGSDIKLSVFPNPANEFLTVISSRQQEAIIANSSGQLVQKLSLINGNQTVNIADWKPGVYFIKTEVGVLKFTKI